MVLNRAQVIFEFSIRQVKPTLELKGLDLSLEMLHIVVNCYVSAQMELFVYLPELLRILKGQIGANISKQNAVHLEGKFGVRVECFMM